MTRKTLCDEFDQENISKNRTRDFFFNTKVMYALSIQFTHFGINLFDQCLYIEILTTLSIQSLISGQIYLMKCLYIGILTIWTVRVD